MRKATLGTVAMLGLFFSFSLGLGGATMVVAQNPPDTSAPVPSSCDQLCQALSVEFQSEDPANWSVIPLTGYPNIGEFVQSRTGSALGLFVQSSYEVSQPELSNQLSALDVHGVFDLTTRLSYVAGDLIQNATSYPTSGLIVTMRSPGGAEVVLFIPLSPELLTNDPDQTPPPAASGDDSDDRCLAIAHGRCGSEPVCPVAGEGGIQQCMEAADCNMRRCDWADCFNATYDNCGPIIILGVVTPRTACLAVWGAETIGCVPGYIIDLL